jgi:hypothetical protein
MKTNKMPPQKNSGNKGAKRETGASSKNRRFIQNFLDDLRTEGGVQHVHIGRVTKRLGDGRMEVFFTEKVKGNDSKGRVAQAVIRGSFRGRGKHSVWIDVGSFVAIADTGVSGPSALEIVGVLTAEQMREVGREMQIDPRVLAVDATDTTQLLSSKMTAADDKGYDFDTIEEDDEEEVDVDAI